MKCLNCGFTNTPDARFCQQCGKRLNLTCPNCSTQNPGEAHFCKQCGYDLTTPIQAPALGPGQAPARSAAPPLTRRSISLPPSTLEKARSSAAPGGERRVVTILFADVVNSTGLAEQLDPEDWAAIMNRAYDWLTPIVYRYEGTVARLMGDALLAFFGAPLAHEDDPLRAAQAALDMIAASAELSDNLRSEYGIDFAIRIGLNTGQVVVGEIGSNLVYEYTAMGDAVNLAARMQAAARPMTALLAEPTYRLIMDLFQFEDRGTIPVKGKTGQIHVYELVGRATGVQPHRGYTGLFSPMVGRGAELETLLHMTQTVKAGLGRACLVVGDPGIGKSRLVAEWKNRAAGEDLAWAEGHCLSFGQGLAYHLLIDLLRSTPGLTVNANEADLVTALNNLTHDLFGPEAGTLTPYLAHLLSLPIEGPALEQVKALEPQALQTQYLVSIRRLLSALAARRPLVVLLDDIHWADSSSVELLTRLMTLVTEVPVLLCLVTRPDREAPGWRLVGAAREQFGSGMTEIILPALGEAESRELIANLLSSPEFPEQARTLVLSKSEGNPLFVEEVIRMLVDRGFLTRLGDGWTVSGQISDVDIPDNLHSLLLARIDRLPEEVRQTLRVAAVIGRQFPVRVLQAVLDRRASLP